MFEHSMHWAINGTYYFNLCYDFSIYFLRNHLLMFFWARNYNASLELRKT